jgi:hypothetical protein
VQLSFYFFIKIQAIKYQKDKKFHAPALDSRETRQYIKPALLGLILKYTR